MTAAQGVSQAASFSMEVALYPAIPSCSQRLGVAGDSLGSAGRPRGADGVSSHCCTRRATSTGDVAA